MSKAKKIDWDLIQIIVLTATIPVMLLIGAFLPSIFTPAYLP